MLPKVCLVTTLRDASSTVDFFINYHLYIGFSHIFLFFDDPAEANSIINLGIENITILKNNEELHKAWKNTKSFEFYHSHIDNEVMARQILNVEVATKLAGEKGFDWILHIDIDELFYSPEEQVEDHFKKMEMSGISAVTYLNHEAISEKFDINNHFTEVTLFKKNILLLNEDQKQMIKLKFSQSKPYFNFYKIGKSAAKITPGLLPFDVHDFVANGEKIKVGKPCILHYACCGYDNFITKYKTLANFNDKWFDKIEIIQRLPVHVISRDVVSSEEEGVAEAYYKEIFMEQNEERKNAFLEKGIYFRVPGLTLLNY